MLIDLGIVYVCFHATAVDRVVVTKIIWSTEPKTFSIWLFTENVWQPILENKGLKAPKSFLSKTPSWRVAKSHGNTVTKNNDIVL